MNKIFFTLWTLFFSVSLSAQANPTSAIAFAWIRSLDEIELIVDVPGGIDIRELQILDSSRKAVPFDLVATTGDSLILRPRQSLSLEKNYFVKLLSQEIYAYYTVDFAARHFHYRGNLGVQLSPGGTEAHFKLWSPSAEAVSVLVSSPVTHAVLFTQKLDRKDRGLWTARISGKGELDGLLYQYRIHAYGADAKALDPYAKSMAAFNPKENDEVGFGTILASAQSKFYQPPSNQKDDAQFMGMEVQVRDATSSPDSPAPEFLKGTYLGLISALDYFKDLGITHLQIQPLQNFYSVNENKRSYQDDSTARSEINYNWGYDPQNYFTPEGWYSTDAKDPYARIRELQKMTDEIHARGLGVILDVVYNHVYNGQVFERAAPGLYLRRNRRGEVSYATGAGASLESRSVMVRRLIVDSLKYWQNVYHIDGFRFDLMGFIDKETMVEVRKALHPNTILYGEAWVFTDLPQSDATIKTDLPHALNISAFNDTSRDAYAGREQGRGFIQGDFGNELQVRAGIIGGIRNHPQSSLISSSPYDSFTARPPEAMNYLSIHDGFTLWYKINLSSGGSQASRIQLVKNAYALLFTSQGRVIFQQGCEAGRSKPLRPNDPHPDRAHTTDITVAENGVSYFHENSYASSDLTNAFSWTRAQDFSELKDYVKGLAALRRMLPGLHFNLGSSVQKGLHFIEPTGAGLIAYLIDNTLEGPSKFERILVIHNAQDQIGEVTDPEIAQGNWQILADCERAGTQQILSSTVNIVGNKVIIPAKCSAVLAR